MGEPGVKMRGTAPAPEARGWALSLMWKGVHHHHTGQKAQPVDTGSAMMGGLVEEVALEGAGGRGKGKVLERGFQGSPTCTTAT